MVHAIVGVMPLGFAFPVAHGYCVPLRITDADLQPGPGPAMYVSEIASVPFGSRECVSFCISAARAEPPGCGEKLVEPHACVDVRTVHSTASSWIESRLPHFGLDV
jgi:hypothetical protein